MEIDMLMDCSVKFIQLLLRQYDHKRIDRDFLRKNINLKIKFIRANIYRVRSYEQRDYIDSILSKCDDILIKY